ncbi:MAG: S41 family peptidase [Vicinamibacterales bacterium]|nr:S41 family peptidase [Vicinamibacterales bacterium]
MTARTRLAVLLVSTPLVAFALVGGFLGQASAREESYQHLRIFEDVVSLVTNNYVEEVNVDAVMDGAMRGLAEGLDADSAWLAADQVAQFEAGAPAPQGETGIDLVRQYYLRVVSVLDGSPAAAAGLRTGDYLRMLDGKATRDLSAIEGHRLLRGPVGSPVKLLVLRGNAAEPHEVTLTRQRLTTPGVSGRLLEQGVGLLRIPAFAADTAAQVGRTVADLQKQGATRLLLDLRATSVGAPADGLATARLFVASGTLAQREARGQAASPVTADAGDGGIALPMVVMTSAGTAGAAEVFAAAVAGNARATIVGERTLGRAAEQKLVRLPDGSGLWLTYARFLTPEGKPLHGQGVEPSVAVEEPDVEFGGDPPATDPILDKAVELLTSGKAPA